MKSLSSKLYEVVDIDLLQGSPCGRYGHTSIIFEDKLLFLFGGSNGRKFFNDLWIFDLDEMKWVAQYEAPSSIDGRHFHSVCLSRSFSDQKRLIFFGGKSNGYKNDTFLFCLKSRTFKPLKISTETIPSPRYGHTSCFYGEKMYMFGGYDKNGFTKNDFYSLSFLDNNEEEEEEEVEWERIKIPKIPFRYQHSSELIDHHFYIICGSKKNNTALSDVYRIDLRNNYRVFRLRIENPIGLYGHQSFVLEGSKKNKKMIYMYGGKKSKSERNNKLLCLREMIDCESGEKSFCWKEDSSFLINNSTTKNNHYFDYSTISVSETHSKVLFFKGKNYNIHNRQKFKYFEEEKEVFDYFSTDSVPYDCIFIIFSFLTEKELFRVSITSKKNWSFSTTAKQDRIWSQRYIEAKDRSFLSKRILQQTIPNHVSEKNKMLGWSKKKVLYYHQFRLLRRLEFRKQEKMMKEMGSLMDYSANQVPKVYGSNNNSAIQLKCVQVGDGAVGKTCLFIRMNSGRFPDEYVPTIFDNYTNRMKVGREQIFFQLWDTAGEEDYDRLRPLSYRDTNVFLISFSLVNHNSLRNVTEKWYPEIRHHCPKVPVVLCGTKLDFRDNPQPSKTRNQCDGKPVSTMEAIRVARKIGAVKYIETSAKNDVNVTKNSILLKLLCSVALEHGMVEQNRSICGIM